MELKINKIADRNLTNDEMNILPGGGEDVCNTKYCVAQIWGQDYDWNEDFLHENYLSLTRY